MSWQPIETAPRAGEPVEVLFRNGSTAFCPSPRAHGPIEITEDFDEGWMPTHWRYPQEAKP